MRDADAEANALQQIEGPATSAPWTTKQKWINLLKTSLVPLALLNLYLLPFDMHFLRLFQYIETPVDGAICVAAILILAIHSHPAGVHVTKKVAYLYVMPVLLLLCMSLWYDWLVVTPPSKLEGTQGGWPMWAPQHWVRPGRITGHAIRAAVCSSFANAHVFTLLLSGKFAVSKAAKTWAIRTRTRRILLFACNIYTLAWMKILALMDEMTFDSAVVFGENDFMRLTDLWQSWVEFGNPFAPHAIINWGTLIMANLVAAFILNALLFRLRGGGIFYTFNRNTWRSSFTMEPALPAVLKTEKHDARYLRPNADQLLDEHTAPEKEGNLKDEESMSANQEDMELRSMLQRYSSSRIYGPVNIAVLGGFIVLCARVAYEVPHVFGWANSI